MTPDDFDAPRPPERGARSESIAPRPLLASEALKDELAPVEPLRRAAVVGALTAGAFLGAMGFAPAWNPAGKPWVELACSAALIGFGAAPLSYATRAMGLLVCGLLVGLAGVAGIGPASVVGYSVGEWGVLSLIAAVALPAALLFRSHYRAYGGARPILAAALVLCGPFAIFTGFGLNADSPLIAVTSGAALVALGLGLLGFMGSQAALAGGALAAVIVAAIASPVAAHAGARLELTSPLEWLSALGSSLAFAVGCGVASLGGFQLLASRHWVRARAVDVHPPRNEMPAPAPSAPSLTDTWNDRR